MAHRSRLIVINFSPCKANLKRQGRAVTEAWLESVPHREPLSRVQICKNPPAVFLAEAMPGPKGIHQNKTLQGGVRDVKGIIRLKQSPYPLFFFFDAGPFAWL